MQDNQEDPYLWLEEIESPEALEWVRRQNTRTEQGLASTPEFRKLASDLQSIYDSDANIPYVGKQGAWYYNFWTDGQHERGIWRRTTLEEYRKPQPAWETVLDLDALNVSEKANWVWDGADFLRPDRPDEPCERCLISLSRGGGDATVTREFDLVSRTFLRSGFQLPEAKGEMGWINRDTVYVSTDFGSGSLSASGYPRIVKQWRRGTPLEAATVVYEGQPEDMQVSAWHDDTPGFERDFVARVLDFYEDELHVRHPSGELTKIDVPDWVTKGVFRQWLTLGPRRPWTVGKKTYAVGSFLVIDFARFLAGDRHFDVLFEPTTTVSLESVTFTLHHVVLNVLEDVRSQIRVFARIDGRWQQGTLTGVPEFGDVSVDAVDGDTSDAVWITVTDFLTPTTLMLGHLGEMVEPEILKTQPAFFDATRDVVEQHFATSADGTRVPYFLVRPKTLAQDGTAPALLTGYGGFEVSMLPAYSATIGKGWLERGGVYVVANIRGGGEYGPEWHQAALKEHRHKAFEDFAAVARDLIDRKITSPRHLGIEGGSNGGLLTGNMLIRYPELFGAVVINVPLLDMQRYNQLLAGASWVAEYGNPDLPEEWAYLKTFSPYHLFDPARNYPPALITTSTRDDRVHPGHARKMLAKMLAAGKDVTYYENIEGGHGGAADNRQEAYMSALYLTFLWQRLTTTGQS